MNITKKVALMFCLMMGTALYIFSLDKMVGYVGLIDILSHNVAVVLLIGGFYIISNTKEK